MEGRPQNSFDEEALRLLKHDIKNQLSGMILCVEQLRFDLSNQNPDWKYYIDSISDGCTAIDKIVEKL